MMQSVADGWLWGGFIAIVGTAFYVDLRDLVRHSASEMLLRHALFRSLAWVGLAFVFYVLLAGYLYLRSGVGVAIPASSEFLSAYLIEKTLSFDNLFVILMIFKSIGIPEASQRRVLFWGVLGAAFMRLVAIFAGLWLVHLFSWLLYVFGVFIFYTGVHLLFKHDKPEDPTKSWLFRWVSRHMPMTHKIDNEHFWVREAGKWMATPLLLSLIMVELSDLIFAVDSIPAVFAITLDPFIAFTSNMFAVLGLRALYFVLAHADKNIDGLQIGIALVLMITGIKMLINPWYHLPSGWMLLLVLGILFVTGLIGWMKKNRMQLK